MENKKMKNKIMVLMISAICATSIMQAEHEPILAETVEMPGNVVGSLFGGGYAKRSHDKKEMREQEEQSNKKMKNKKSNKKSTPENSKSKSRKRSRPTEERS
jgi:sRNA-binding protein